MRLFKGQSDEVIGNICIANKSGGFTTQDLKVLEPFTVTGSNLIQAYWQVEKNRMLIQTLEEKVKERTHKLELANKFLEEANERVVKASAAQLQHFACMSHEIRTPLNCIIGLSSLIRETPNLDPLHEESISMIVASGELLLQVVNDVLDYSKLESGNVEITMRRSSLQEALISTVSSIEMKAQSKKLTVRTFYDVALPGSIHTDCIRLQQILFNLLGNAVKFSKDGGFVDLSIQLITGTICPTTKDSSKNADEDNAGQQQPIIRFIVKDYGKGLDREEFDVIFQPFKQASAETLQVYGGTGLGLPITTKLVQAMGGSISVDSEKGSWSEFTVDLPFQDARVNMDKASSSLRNKTILLVDRDEDNVRRLEEIFAQYTVECISFRCIGEVEDYIRKAGPRTRRRDGSHICLLQEDLYLEEPFRNPHSLASSILVTFGPKFSVRDGAGHFRSLLKQIPSVLIESITRLADRNQPEPNSTTTSSALTSSSGLRILIAEDNTVNQKVMSRVLKRIGIEGFDIVDDGQKAVDQEGVKKYDVILMDMQMPM